MIQFFNGSHGETNYINHSSNCHLQLRTKPDRQIRSLLLEWDEIKYIPEYDNYGKLVKVNEIALKDIFSTKFMRKTAATIDNTWCTDKNFHEENRSQNFCCLQQICRC